jgi:hypothetical protein
MLQKRKWCRIPIKRTYMPLGIQRIYRQYYSGVFVNIQSLSATGIASLVLPTTHLKITMQFYIITHRWPIVVQLS